MRKFYTIFLSLLTVMLLPGCYDCESRENVLKIYNWGDYIDEEVLAAFPEWYKEQTGEDVRIVYQTFDINEIMLTKIERGKEDFDVVCPSEYIIERMLVKDLLVPIDTAFGKTPNYIHNISPYVRGEMEKLSVPGRPTSKYAVGYMWGTAGILYNKSNVTREEASTWHSLWDSKFRNKLLMKDSYRDAYGTAVIYANRDALAKGDIRVEDLMNNYSSEAIATAEKYLKELKPNIAGWEADFGKEMMTKNKAYLNMTWSGDAVWAIEEAEAVGVELGYEVPMEGSNVWFDGWVIPRYSRNRKAASYFINYLCRPDVALANMETIGYVSAVATPEILEEKIDTTLETYSNLAYFFGPEARHIQIDPIQYPDSSVVARCAIIRDAGDNTQAVLDMWSHVKGDNLGGGLVAVILITLVVLVIYVSYQKIKRYKNRQNQSRRKRRVKRHVK
ncbi:ABC transporter substrate-binding protein [Bacteroides caecigallinarum]|uniref:ABC transporter substrate-binding protein n=2 Tax=Bacteroides TaxID=816 RepID=UPI0019576E9E|nr:ABC transporter substrate-binding protein [Bacteroides caecigallinarum]